ncbi:hypothetical protein BGZ81_008657 [Podila clonocystis]|nr:hypothetical protein BGZ81_008657 [Podila clonocystis]
MVKEQQEYNILILGETQSGKSTLVEFLSAYANPSYVIKEDNVGDGIFSKTEQVKTTAIHTDLPSYFVSDKAGKQVDYGKFICQDQEDYEDELNERKKYQLKRGDPTAATATFNLIDTPGLNDTGKFDESNIATIFKALEAIKSVHLVVITVANNPFTEGLQNAIKAYIDLLPDFNGSLVFVHTKVDYAKMHPNQRQFIESYAEKKTILNNLAGRDSVPHLLIDNDIVSTRVIRNCITKNMHRELLDMAQLNQPVALQLMVMNKTEKIRIIDNILKAKVEAIIAQQEKTLGAKDQARHVVLAAISELKDRMNMHEQRRQDIERDRRFNDREALFLLHEDTYYQNWGWLKLAEPKTHMYYPEKKHIETPDFTSYAIDHVDMRAHNVNVQTPKGGKGHNYWSVKFRRNRFQNGKFHVKIYIQKKKKFATALAELSEKDRVCRDEILVCERDLKRFEQEEQENIEYMKDLLEDLQLNRYLHGRVSMSKLDSKVFHELVEAKVFVHHDRESVANLEKFYVERRAELEKLDKENKSYVDPAPVDNSATTDDGTNATQDK